MSENANSWREYANRHFHRRCWPVSWHHHFGRRYYPARLGAGRSSSPGFMLLEKLVWVRTPRTQVQGMVPTPWLHHRKGAGESQVPAYSGAARAAGSSARGKGASQVLLSYRSVAGRYKVQNQEKLYCFGGRK